MQVEKLGAVGRELKRKQRQAQMQARGLVEERADFLAQLQDQNRELINLRARLGLARKENEDLTKSHGYADLTNKVVYDLDDPDRPRFTTAELKEILHERNELKARVSDLEDELELYRPKPETYVGCIRQKKLSVSIDRCFFLTSFCMLTIFFIIRYYYFFAWLRVWYLTRSLDAKIVHVPRALSSGSGVPAIPTNVYP